MTESLVEFITRRRVELEELESPLRERLGQIAVEKEQLKRAAMAAGIEVVTAAGPTRSIVSRSPRRLGKMTLKEAVVEILTDNPNGLGAMEILRELNSRHKTDFARESLSPQISRLKQEGHLELTGRFWHLKGQTLKEIEVPDQNLFEGTRSGTSYENPAKDREAGSGGGV